MKMFEVGGCVRDEILGVVSKDIDFSVVLDDFFFEDGLDRNGNTPFEVMTLNLRKQGFKIFLESPEFLTVRAQFPKSANRGNLTADFVLARSESDYTDGRRPDKVVPGTLEDDLARRDFTMNAIAKDSEGNLIDPFNGRKAIEDMIIRAVGDPFARLSEDSLRAVRAMRFAVTKSMDIEGDLRHAMEDDVVLDNIASGRISSERVDIELQKMFKFSTLTSLSILQSFPRLTEAMFATGKVHLTSTMKQKGFQ